MLVALGLAEETEYRAPDTPNVTSRRGGVSGEGSPNLGPVAEVRSRRLVWPDRAGVATVIGRQQLER